ncbi:MAG: hypothetical protein DRI71_00125 [Bacteroidetes bacterium]|nr:MAG: hypothetical protein DRI71_00125 [Bacteroidota bacterium]
MQIQNYFTASLAFLLVIIGVTMPGILVAQTVTISGNVSDSNSGEPLAFATVALKNEPFGTITNLAGDFDFHVPKAYGSSVIVISTLGYVNFSISVNDARLQENLIVLLEAGHVVLDEVMVTEDLSAENLLRIAINNIEINYPMSPVSMDGFYRDTKKVDGEYVALLEAAVTIYDKDYSAPRDYTKLRERVSLVEVRRTHDYDFSLKKYFNQYNVMEDLLLENLVKYRTFNNEQEFYNGLSRKKVAGYNNQPIDLVFIELPDYTLKIYIDDNYGIRKIIFIWGDDISPIYTYRKSGKLENQVMKLEKQIEFQEYNGKLYLKYISARYQNNWIDRKSGELLLITERDQELLINKLNYANPQWIKNSKKMKRYGLQFQHEAYNKEFWAIYNTIKDLPLSNLAQKDLEKLFSLEEQFESFE